MGGSCSNCLNRFPFRRQAGGTVLAFDIYEVEDEVEDEVEECAKTPSWLSFVEQEDAEGNNVFVDDRCFICLEDFNEQNLPRIIPCGHIVCNQCLIELGRSSVFTKIQCPQDRHWFKVKRRNMPETESREIPDVESTASVSIASGLFLPGVNHTTMNPLYNLDSQPEVDIESNISTGVMDSSTSIHQSNSVKSNSSSIMNISIQGNYSGSNSSSNISWRDPKYVMRKQLPDMPRLYNRSMYDDVYFYEPPPDYPTNDEDNE